MDASLLVHPNAINEDASKGMRLDTPFLFTLAILSTMLKIVADLFNGFFIVCFVILESALVV
jgi:hypothetical protein